MTERFPIIISNVIHKIVCLLRFLHFSNNEKHNTSHDRLAKFNSLLILLKATFNSVYIFGSITAFDEIKAPCGHQFSLR